MTCIWQRYILSHFAKLFAFSLFGLYFLYVIIDCTTHMQGLFQGSPTPIAQIALYYLLQFVKRAEILVPVALLLSTIRTLSALNTNCEWLAFQSAGIPQQQLLRPLFIVSLICTGFVFSVNEVVAPYCLDKIDQFYYAHLRHSFRGKRLTPFRVTHLDGHSYLVYQDYDPSKRAYFDVIWIQSADELWKMKYLIADADTPEGRWVDHLKRDARGCFQKVHSFKRVALPDIRWDQKLANRSSTPFENRPALELWKLLRSESLLFLTERDAVLTQLLFKLSFPLLSLLAYVGIAPYCTRFSRLHRSASIYAGGIFSLVALIALLDSAVILGESGTLSPLFGIVSPFILLIGIFGYKFFRS